MSNDDQDLSNSRFGAGREAGLELPALSGTLSQAADHGRTLSMEGTNVVRVPFGVRQPRRSRPARPDQIGRAHV